MHNNRNARKALGWTDEKGESGFNQVRSPWYSGETNSVAWLWRWRRRVSSARWPLRGFLLLTQHSEFLFVTEYESA